MYEYYFTGRKPSNSQVLKKINEGINQGHDYIEISWGENMITFEKQLVNGKREIWYGFGWLKDIDASAIAREINLKNEKQLLNLYNT